MQLFNIILHEFGSVVPNLYEHMTHQLCIKSNNAVTQLPWSTVNH